MKYDNILDTFIFQHIRVMVKVTVATLLRKTLSSLKNPYYLGQIYIHSNSTRVKVTVSSFRKKTWSSNWHLY